MYFRTWFVILTPQWPSSLINVRLLFETCCTKVTLKFLNNRNALVVIKCTVRISFTVIGDFSVCDKMTAPKEYGAVAKKYVSDHTDLIICIDATRDILLSSIMIE